MIGAGPRDGRIGEPLREALDELEVVILSLSLEEYTAAGAGVHASSIGAHVRHCLDHVAALVTGARTGRVDYESRERGSPVEIDRQAALVRIERLRRDVASLPADGADRAVDVIHRAGGAARLRRLRSSLGREIAFVVSHTTHHNAIIRAKLEALGGRTPERFGYAAGTIAWSESLRVHRDDRPAA